MGILFAGLSALLFGCADFSGGIATRHSPVLAVLVVSQLAGLALALVAAPLLGSETVTLTDLLWGAAAGLTGSLGLALLYKGLAVGIVSVVSPVTAVIGAAVPVLAGVLLGDTPGIAGWAGITLGLPAIALLAWQRMGQVDTTTLRRSLRYAVAAGAGFGAFFILISRPAHGAGFWPLVAARATSITVVSVLALAHRGRFRITRESSGAVVIAGVFDMAANIAFVLASRLALLPVVSVITSLYPAPTVLLGRLVLGERLSPARIVGLVLAISGVILMSL